MTRKQDNHLIFAFKIQLPHQVFLDKRNWNITVPATVEDMRKITRKNMQEYLSQNIKDIGGPTPTNGLS